MTKSERERVGHNLGSITDSLTCDIERFIPWIEFKKQLDDEEIFMWESMIREAKHDKEPQVVLFGTRRIGIVFPSGLIGVFKNNGEK